MKTPSRKREGYIYIHCVSYIIVYHLQQILLEPGLRDKYRSIGSEIKANISQNRSLIYTFGLTLLSSLGIKRDLSDLKGFRAFSPVLEICKMRKAFPLSSRGFEGVAVGLREDTYANFCCSRGRELVTKIKILLLLKNTAYRIES